LPYAAWRARTVGRDGIHTELTNKKRAWHDSTLNCEDVIFKRFRTSGKEGGSEGFLEDRGFGNLGGPPSMHGVLPVP